MDTLVFVCTANRCRSIFAEQLFKRSLETTALQVCSAGILIEDYWEFLLSFWSKNKFKLDRSSFYGVPPYHQTTRCLEKIGVDVSNYKSQPFDRRLAQVAKLVITMEEVQKTALQQSFPELNERIYTFREFVGDTGTVIYEDTLFKPHFDPWDAHGIDFPKSYVEGCFREIENGLRKGQQQILSILTKMFS
ncbi:MAG: hypothetical protein PHO01_02340 [Desulfotomaculaceae bacterium]|nr:hypothetical protein [Desulfotomaculaceae bacterium]